jgi:hypothetical protein
MSTKPRSFTPVTGSGWFVGAGDDVGDVPVAAGATGVVGPVGEIGEVEAVLVSVAVQGSQARSLAPVGAVTLAVLTSCPVVSGGTVPMTV